jgi:two-component system response regulator NreC
MSRTARVVICDDHELFRDGLKALLRAEPDIEVIGEAGNGRQGVDAACALRPDVVLMDVEMPELDGLEATRRIRDAAPEVNVLMLTMYVEEELVAASLRAGACGYMLKDVPSSQLVYAIHVVSRGGRYMSPAALSSVVERWVDGAPRPGTSYDLLTGREREVLKLFAEGRSAKQVAAHLGLSVKTVGVHKTNLMRKLDVHDRAELVRWAVRNRVIRLPVTS